MSDEPDEPTTEQLRAVQQDRAADERDRARKAQADDDARAHERRATKADYLAEKLAEQSEADDEADGG